MKSVFICCPLLHYKKSIGIMALVDIGRELSRLGHGVEFVCILSEYPQEEILLVEDARRVLGERKFLKIQALADRVCIDLGIRLSTSPDSNDHSLVIYPERIIENPLRFKNVVRYFGNRDGALNGGRTVNIGPNDLIVSHSRIIRPNADVYLFYPSFPVGFEGGNTSVMPHEHRTESITYTGKGHLYGEVSIVEGTVLVTRESPPSRVELEHLLAKSKFIFTWDTWSNIIVESIFFGCVPVLLVTKPFSIEEIQTSELAPLPIYQASDIFYKNENFYLKEAIEEAAFDSRRSDLIERAYLLKRNFFASVSVLSSKLSLS
jgi:hypothetical protein